MNREVKKLTGEFIVAAHSVVFLDHHRCCKTSEEIAENVCTNPARVRKVMGKLKKAGLIVTREGAAHGGYEFRLDAEKVTLLQIFEAVDTAVVSPPWKTGSPDLPCLIASGMEGVMKDVFSRMDDECRKELASITVADLSRRLIGKHDL